MSTSRFREDQSERIRRRCTEARDRYGETVGGAYQGSQIQNSWMAGRAAIATVGDQRRSIEEQHLANRRAQAREFVSASRAASRRAMNAMTKTVEIADGSADFRSLMLAAYGKEVMRCWKHAKAVFEDATGLTLIQETEEDEDL